MQKRVVVTPGWIGAGVFWFGSDHYSLASALRRAPFELPVAAVERVYEVRSKPILGLGGRHRFAVAYHSGQRDCLISLTELPKELQSFRREELHSLGFMGLFFRRSWREPTALLLPVVMVGILAVMMLLVGVWDSLVLHNQDFLSFFTKPGCDEKCVRQVLSLHSLIAWLFLVHLIFLFLPAALFFFQAPRYRTAFNYRFMQSFSFGAALAGLLIFAQLMFMFPFKRYGQFLELGIDHRAEVYLSGLQNKK